MKRQELFCLIFFYSIFGYSLFGQSSKGYTLKWSDLEKEKRRGKINKVISTDEKGVYVLRTNGEELLTTFEGVGSILIEYIDKKSLKVIRSKNLELNSKEEGTYRILELENNLYLFTTFHDKKIKEIYLYGQGIDKQSLEKSKKKLMGKWDTSDSGVKIGRFELHRSIDFSKLLFFHDLSSKAMDKRRVGMMVFDVDLNKLWSKEIDLDGTRKEMRIEEAYVDNDGNAYVSTRKRMFYKTIKNFEESGDPFVYPLYCFSDDGSKKNVYTIKLGDLKIISKIKFLIKDEHNIFCFGFFSELTRYHIKGYFLKTINNELEEIEYKKMDYFKFDSWTADFPDYGLNDIKKNGELPNSFEINEICFGKNDNLILVCESNFRTSDNADLYIYGNIATIDLSLDGKINWIKNISKIQRSKNDNGYHSSYIMAMVKDKIYYLFNYNPNKKLKLSKTNLTLVSLDSKGNIKRTDVSNNANLEVMTVVKASKQISENEIFLYGNYDGNFRKGLIRFKD